MILVKLVSAAVFGAFVVTALCVLPAGRTAYWKQVRPVVARYDLALSYGAD